MINKEGCYTDFLFPNFRIFNFLVHLQKLYIETKIFNNMVILVWEKCGGRSIYALVTFNHLPWLVLFALFLRLTSN